MSGYVNERYIECFIHEANCKTIWWYGPYPMNCS